MALALYRKYRPATFSEVVGQEHIVRTLSNAVEKDRVHHAYLFVGSRGTGKTSMAKILASCLNCVNGPTIEPCGVCESCRLVTSGASLDVTELDACDLVGGGPARLDEQRQQFAWIADRLAP